MSRKVIRVRAYRASLTVKSERVPDMVIDTTFGEIPEPADKDWQGHHRQIHEKVATEIADAMFLCLPGGTVDALLVELMTRRASLLKVRF